MTFLVLTLVVPTAMEVRDAGDLWHALLKLMPNVVTYFMSFLTLGIFWVAQETQLSEVARTDRDYTWIMLTFLLFVTFVSITRRGGPVTGFPIVIAVEIVVALMTPPLMRLSR